MEKIRLAIATPSTGNVRIEYMESVLGAVKSLLTDPLILGESVSAKVEDVKLIYHCSSVIPMNRHWIVRQAQSWAATHILWIDDDMQFEPVVVRKILHSLLKEKVSILGANCVKRTLPTSYMALYMDGTPVHPWDTNTPDEIREVLFTGFSFILMRMEVFQKTPLPWFAFSWDNHKEMLGTEDHFFMQRTRQLSNYKSYILPSLSYRVNHIGYHTFKPDRRPD